MRGEARTMDTTRLAVVIALAGGALVDILIAVYLTLSGGLAFALNKPADPRSIAILLLMLACFVAPPIALSYLSQEQLSLRLHRRLRADDARCACDEIWRIGFPMDYYIIHDRDKPARRSTRRTAKAALNVVRNFHRAGAKNIVVRNSEGRTLKPNELATLVPKRGSRIISNRPGAVGDLGLVQLRFAPEDEAE